MSAPRIVPEAPRLEIADGKWRPEKEGDAPWVAAHYVQRFGAEKRRIVWRSGTEIVVWPLRKDCQAFCDELNDDE